MHALLALAKRDRERAAISMLSFAMHPTWQVRMYTARAAAIVDDAASADAPGVGSRRQRRRGGVDATATAIGADSDALFVEVLNRRTRTVTGTLCGLYEVIRTAALALDKATPTPALVDGAARARSTGSPRSNARHRATRGSPSSNGSRSSGRPRRHRPHAPPQGHRPEVARAAAEVLTRWTGKVAEIDTPHQSRLNIPTAEDLANRVRPFSRWTAGGRFEIRLEAEEAPLARTRFLARGSTWLLQQPDFHRVVPNFIIQGGSPGANGIAATARSCGTKSAAMHERGTIGISTRGPDTGDAQIFINLVDNPRLDFDYTVFARVLLRDERRR